ncbi:MAG TPA: GNAT family N-acetyltransferase [Mycobacteriales bacterium]|nr:GNAT family N-acetyltransferase [Mycobacteriales bacterium]
MWTTLYEDLVLPSEGPARLRPWRPDDAVAVARALDERARRYMPPLRHDGPQDARDYVARAPQRWAEGRHLRLCLAGDDDGVLGAVDLDGLDETPGTGELGWWVVPGARGRGVGTVAVRLGLRLGLEGLGLRRISAAIRADNAASRWVAASAGMHLDATLTGADTETGADIEVWRLLAGEEPLAPQPEITAGAVHLRPFRSSDTDAVHAAFQDESIGRYTGAPYPCSRADAERFTNQSGLAMWAAGEGVVYAVCDSTAGDLLGGVGLYEHSRTWGRAELGYWATPAARGRGAITQASAALMRFGRDALGVRIIVWNCVVGNEPSRRVAERLGFTFEGVRRGGFIKNGVVSDDWMASLLTADLG